MRASLEPPYWSWYLHLKQTEPIEHQGMFAMFSKDGVAYIQENHHYDTNFTPSPTLYPAMVLTTSQNSDQFTSQAPTPANRTGLSRPDLHRLEISPNPKFHRIHLRGTARTHRCTSQSTRSAIQGRSLARARRQIPPSSQTRERHRPYSYGPMGNARPQKANLPWLTPQARRKFRSDSILLFPHHISDFSTGTVSQ
jgi:hypothetical protein